MDTQVWERTPAALAFLDGASLARLECCAKTCLAACAGAWECVLRRRFGAVCGGAKDHRREYSEAARGGAVLEWHRGSTSHRATRPLAACGWGESGVAIWAAWEFSSGVVFLDCNAAETRFVEAPCSARDAPDLRCVGDSLFVHGGCVAEVGARVAETWILRGDGAWTLADANAWPTVHHSCDVVGEKLVIFAGQRFDGEPSNECVFVDAENARVLEKVGPWPPPRSLHASCAIDSDKLLVAGGIRLESVGTLDDLWLLEGTAWTRVAFGSSATVARVEGYVASRGRGRALGGAPLAISQTNIEFGLWRCELKHADGKVYLCGDGGVASFRLDLGARSSDDGRVVAIAYDFVQIAPPRRLLDATHAFVGTSLLVTFGGNNGEADPTWYEIAGHVSSAAAWTDVKRRRRRRSSWVRVPQRGVPPGLGHAALAMRDALFVASLDATGGLFYDILRWRDPPPSIIKPG